MPAVVTGSHKNSKRHWLFTWKGNKPKARCGTIVHSTPSFGDGATVTCRSCAKLGPK